MEREIHLAQQVTPHDLRFPVAQSLKNPIGGASVKLFLPIFKMNFPEIVDLALPAEGVFHNLVFVSSVRCVSLVGFGVPPKSSVGQECPARRPTRQAGRPRLPYKTMHGLWGMGRPAFAEASAGLGQLSGSGKPVFPSF